MSDHIDVMTFHHSVFEPVDENGSQKYVVRKDVFNHLSLGATISGNMLNAYLAIIPSSARVFIGDNIS